ncbi:hypothetical protein ABK040_016503 [Willaertia magna]
MKTLLLSLCLGLIAISLVNASCYSNYASYDVPRYRDTFTCPVGFYTAYKNYVYTCKPLTEDMIGKKCSYSSDCKLNWLTCLSNKCVVKGTRLLYDSCETDVNCAYERFEKLKCIQSQCRYTYNNVFRGEGEECNTEDKSGSEKYLCKSGLVCYYDNTAVSSKAYTCRKEILVADGKKCGLVDGVVNNCVSGTVCKAGTCERIQGKTCSSSSECSEAGLMCRYATAKAESRTCERKALLNEYCRSVSDCYRDEYGDGAFTMVKCNEVTNKCQRPFSSKIGESCSSYDDCYSGYCNDAGKCDKLPKTSYGTCADACYGRALDFVSCAWNNGAYLDSRSYFSYQFFDNKSKLFNKCKNELQNYYKCLKGSMKEAGVVGALDSMVYLDLKGNAPTDENPVLPNFNSASSLLTSFALVLMIFTAVFAF